MNSPDYNKPAALKKIANFIHLFIKKIKDLFRLEEVEVTFNKEGYTYTKVAHN